MANNQFHRGLYPMQFSNRYSQLGNAFYKRVLPTPVAKPELLLWNKPLAEELNLQKSMGAERDLLSQYFSGNTLPKGADAIALAYSGHQFGHLNPQLGDGRAHLLGEITNNNQLCEIQLKGSGPTPWSRRGDGRCALGPALREFIMSEAMYYLGVPTSRCLAVVATGENVYRETAQPGAVVTRVASSHIRVGTFQYFALRDDQQSLDALLNFAVDRHFPELKQTRENPALEFLQAVLNKQIMLLVHWMRVGFIHGVMNTDNVAISGETLDFGPCAMMGIYHPQRVFSSIDTHGRYAFANQPNVALWNMARLAECLLPQIDTDEAKAIAKVEALLEQFGPQFEAAHLAMMANKLGLANADEKVKTLIDDFLTILQKQQLDYHQTFLDLQYSLSDTEKADTLRTTFGAWYQTWENKIKSRNPESVSNMMTETNPRVIPRNHHLEAVLKKAESETNLQAVDSFLEVLRSPYRDLPNTQKYAPLPEDGDKHYRTFCGT